MEQFRIPLQRQTIEIPAGIVGDEEEFLGEALADTAARELLEETGYRAGSMVELIASPTSGGFTSEYIHLFHAKDLVLEHAGGGTHEEDIIVHRVPVSGIREWLRAQEQQGKAIDFKIHAALWHGSTLGHAVVFAALPTCTRPRSDAASLMVSLGTRSGV